MATELTFGEALMNFTEPLSDLVAYLDGYKNKLTNEYHFSEHIAEVMCAHLHMKFVELILSVK